MEYPEDVKRIQKVLVSHNVAIPDEQAEKLWGLYSESHAAGWLLLPDTDEVIWKCISTQPIYSVQDILDKKYDR